MQITIREATLSDHPQLKELFDELDRVHREHAPRIFREPSSDPRPPQWLQQLISDPRWSLPVAVEGECCIGLATVCLKEVPAFPVFIPQQYALIDNLVVHAAWRRRGVARRLYRACESWAEQHNAAWLEVNVWDFNVEALDFYAAVGFAASTHKLVKVPG